MQTTLSMLLAILLIFISSQAVDSLFLSKRRSQLLTLPLTPSMSQQRSDIHPQILLQMHINRSIRRLARMTGVEPPSARSLEQRLEKRVLSIEGPEGIYRRSNQFGISRSAIEGNLAKRFNRASVSDSRPGSSPLSSTSSVQVAGRPSAAHSLGLDIEYHDVGYLATVKIGTPPRDFLVLMDSGSADFWVGAENCQSHAGGGCGNHMFLGSRSSSSFKNTTKPFEVPYGTGQVDGFIVQDNVIIADLPLTSQVFGVASLETVDFSSNDVPFDGLMGLAKSSVSEQGTPTPIESLASAGLVPAPIVSYKIPRLADNLRDGEITFGGLDVTKFDSKTLVEIPNINPDGLWEAKLEGIMVNGVRIRTGLFGWTTTIFDTGTNLMVIPPADAIAIHKNIPGAVQDGQGGFIVPCTTNASIALIYAGQSFTIDPRDLAFQPLDDDDPHGLCVSGIISGDDGPINQWLLGDTFLKNVYLSTDVSKNTVSLAKLSR